MNLQALHSKQTEVSLVSLFKGEAGTVAAMQLPANEILKKHITKIPALLICVTGKVVYYDIKGLEETLSPGEYVHIEPMVEHWVEGVEDSNLLLIK